ncbi:MAG: hypothetical protein HOI41_11960 [Acidimicrobiaceae bacterium]|nr:hypothetical protein [Acidimicrobiaceae bacterium]
MTSPFAVTARHVTELHGLDHMGFAEVAHPITSLTDAELRGRAAIAAPQVEKILLGR